MKWDNVSVQRPIWSNGQHIIKSLTLNVLPASPSKFNGAFVPYIVQRCALSSFRSSNHQFDNFRALFVEVLYVYSGGGEVDIKI